MTVKEILIEWLKTRGYDGLCYDDCGCGLNDFMPCQSSCELCKPAYEWQCSREERIEACDSEIAAYCDEKECQCYRLTKQEG
jgi:hypothetical protein